MFIQKKEKKNGFTLLEMIVSISLFTIVTTIAFSALFSIIDANDKAKTIKLVVNNLSMSMESMIRELRMGTKYKCKTDSGSCAEIEFKTQEGCISVYEYSASETTIYRTRKYKDKGKCVDGTRVRMVGDDINIEELKFYIAGVGIERSTPNVQPRILLIMRGSISKQHKKITTDFRIQTTISQRNPEIE